MEIKIKLPFFSGKRPSVSVENEKSEYAEIAPQAKEWLLTKSTSMRLQCWKERLLCFSGWGGEEEKRHLLGGQLCETETSKHRNMSEVLRRNPSNKTSGICRTFVFRTSTPARAAVTSENKHSICDIFSSSSSFCTVYIYSPKTKFNASVSSRDVLKYAIFEFCI